MNVFRLAGDLSHLIAILILLLKIWRTQSCLGVSGKSICLYAIVFVSRYLDLFTHYVSAYNSFMKLFYISATFLTLYLIYKKFRVTYNWNNDTFKIQYLIVPCLALALVINRAFTFLEIMWTFSIYLESVAVLPQLFMISKTGEAESITTHYLFALGIYRAFYIMNWAYRYFFERYLDLIAIVAGCLQTVLYCDFFYLYVTKVIKGKRLSLPA
ncbi:hypothetical protein ACOME3_008970 [Neoechinorhynchus agilis]